MDLRNRRRRAKAGAAKRSAPQNRTDRGRSADAPDLPAILGRFSDALSLLSVVQRSLSMQEFAGVGDEEISLRRVIDDLKAVYEEIDAAIPLLRPASPARSGASEPNASAE